MRPRCQCAQCLLLLLMLSTCATFTHAYYVRYFNVTAAALLNNHRLLLGYVKCFASEGPCPPQARDIKKLLPELLSSSCSKCDIKLREMYEKSKSLLKKHYPKKLSKMVSIKPNPNAI